jgi:type VI secretion system secreted protein VgrG
MAMASDSSARGSYATITLDPPAEVPLVFNGMKMTEELGRPFQIDLEVTSENPKGDMVGLLGASVCITFQQPGKPDRIFNARLTRLLYQGLKAGAYSYQLVLRPWIWLLSQAQDCRIFQNMSAFKIIREVFSSANYSDVRDERRNGSGDTVLEFCVQYRETSLDFVTRLMEEFGIYYYFEHTSSAHTLVLADAPSSHTEVKPAIVYQRQMTEARTTEDHIWNVNSDLALQSTACTFLDYNFTTPSADLTVKAIDSDAGEKQPVEVYDYPGFYDNADNGKKLVSVRMEELTSRRTVITATTNARAITTGVKFTLSKHPDTSLSQEYLVIGATTLFGAGESRSAEGGDLIDTFRCNLRAIPGKVPFRLDAKTPRPMIRGPQTARVVGASGDEITTDQYGRVKLKFPWDRSTAKDDTASCWIRVAQLWAGTQFGAMFIPRVGQEVIVEYLEGNPDRPIVTGRVYNASVQVPYTLPDEKTKSTIKSNSSTGGGGFNELRFEDKKGSEEIFVNAQKDYNEVVLNNKTVKVTQDFSTTVSQGKSSLTVSQGDHSVTISAGNHSTTVSAKDHSLTVSAGNHSITVSVGKSSITAQQSITLTVGPSSIQVSPSGITLSAPQITLNGTASASISAPSVTVSGDATVAISGGMVSIN